MNLREIVARDSRTRYIGDMMQHDDFLTLLVVLRRSLGLFVCWIDRTLKKYKNREPAPGSKPAPGREKLRK